MKNRKELPSLGGAAAVLAVTVLVTIAAAGPPPTKRPAASHPKAAQKYEASSPSGADQVLTAVYDPTTQTLRVEGAGSGGSGTVTSVGLALPSLFSVTGSPVTSAGTLTGSFVSQNANLVLASPSGSSGAPSFRALVLADLPPLSFVNLTGSVSDVQLANGYSGVGACPANEFDITLTRNAAPACAEALAPFTAPAHEWFNAVTAAGVFSAAQPAFSDISGTVAPSQLPDPGATTLGGIESAASVAHEWINSISTSGVPALSQPAFTDISGTLAAAQLPASAVTFTGTITNGDCTKWSSSGIVTDAGAACGSGGSGTVSSFSSGSLSPLFTTSVFTATTTPALSFTLSNAAANSWFGNATGSSAAPAFNTSAIPVAMGGTGLTSAGASGQCLTSTGTALAWTSCGGSSATFQVNGASTSAQSPINFQNGGYITVSNPSAGNIQFNFSGPLAVANGGTGLTALGTAGQCLQVNTGATALQYGSCGSGGGITLQTNGANDATQTALNLVAGSNITLSNSGASVTISAAAGGGGNATSIQSVPVSATAPASGQALAYNGTNWIPTSISNAKDETASYSVASTDNGTDFAFTCTANCTATLPSTVPAVPWAIGLVNQSGSGIILSLAAPSGVNLNGVAANSIVLQPWESAYVWVDGAGGKYDATVPIIAGSNITATGSSTGYTLAAAGGGVTLYYWMPTAPTTTGNYSLGAGNTIYVSAVPRFPGGNVTFDYIDFTVNTLDSSGDYSIAIYGPCAPGASSCSLVGSLTAQTLPSTGDKNLQISQTGSQTMAPPASGQYYYVAITGSATTAAFSRISGGGYMPVCNALSSTTSSGGAAPSSIAIPSASWIECNQQLAFAVHN